MQIKKIPANKPRRLRPGDTVGIVAPAGPYDPQLFLHGIDALKSLGYAVRIPGDLERADGFLAGPDSHRATLINRFFADDDVRGIICARGGYGSMRILDLLDFELIRSRPKVFIGFSDITALLITLYRRSGLVCFHGPVVTSLGRAGEATLRSLGAAVSGGEPTAFSLEDAVVVKPGRAQGTFCGGNLATLCHLVGTPYAPDFEDCILFLEETNEAPYRIDRMLFQMRLAGCFEGVRGIALGSFDNCGDMQEILGLFGHMFKDRDIPVMAGFDIGHGVVNLTVPVGAGAVLDTERRVLTFVAAATRD